MTRRGLLGCLAAVLTMIPFGSAQAGRTVPPQKEPAADEAVPQLMESIGVLAGFQLYQTYLNIGFIADGRASRLYKETDVRQLLGSIMKPLDKVEEQLEKVGKIAQSREDRETVTRLRKIAGVLREQGKDLEKFWATGRPADGAKYETTRKQAWTEISTLLGLDK